MDIPNEVIGQPRIWHEISELARRSRKTTQIDDACEIIGSSCPSHACHNMRPAEAACWLERFV